LFSIKENKMLKTERQQYIINKLTQDKKVITSELALALNISEDTIRRDLNELENSNILKKVYGGGVQNPKFSSKSFTLDVIDEDLKIKIATKALSLLRDEQVIIMSGGSTNLVFASLIPAHLKITIYTYSLQIAMELSRHPNIDIIFIGGKMQKNAMVTIGMDVIKVLSKIKADICFIGTSGININQGLTEIDYEVATVKRAMIDSSDQVVSMFVSSRLNIKMPHVVCNLSKLDTIVTDLDPQDTILQEYHKAGLKIK
jgi:DeoR/GlpR family transcriptional regulator of sugar metabolism